MGADLQLAVDSAPSLMQRFIAAAPRIALGLAFVYIGWTKFDQHSTWVGIFQRIGLGTWFRYFTGAMQIAGGALTIVPATALAGALVIACTMAGAVAADIFVLHFGPLAIIPFVLLVTSLGVAWQAWIARD